jgi:hypothetical protein
MKATNFNLNNILDPIFAKGTAIVTIILAAISITVLSCNKDFNDRDFPDPTPMEQTQTVSQTFTLTTKADTYNMAKGWDYATYIYQYCMIPQTLTLTGTGQSAGTNYTATATIQQLKAGAITINMLAGTYSAVYKTPHTRTTDVFSANTNSVVPTVLDYEPITGDVLDISVNNPNLSITGAPIPLTAVLDDYLIVLDISQVTEVTITSGGNASPKRRLLYNATDKYHWGYFGDNGAFEKGMPTAIMFKVDGVQKTVDVTGFQKGKVYHVITPFTAPTALTIPGMITQTVIVP